MSIFSELRKKAIWSLLVFLVMPVLANLPSAYIGLNNYWLQK